MEGHDWRCLLMRVQRLGEKGGAGIVAEVHTLTMYCSSTAGVTFPCPTIRQQGNRYTLCSDNVIQQQKADTGITAEQGGGLDRQAKCARS